MLMFGTPILYDPVHRLTPSDNKGKCDCGHQIKGVETTSTVSSGMDILNPSSPMFQALFNF